MIAKVELNRLENVLLYFQGGEIGVYPNVVAFTGLVKEVQLKQEISVLEPNHFHPSPPAKDQKNGTEKRIL